MGDRLGIAGAAGYFFSPLSKTKGMDAPHQSARVQSVKLIGVECTISLTVVYPACINYVYQHAGGTSTVRQYLCYNFVG